MARKDIVTVGLYILKYAIHYDAEMEQVIKPLAMIAKLKVICSHCILIPQGSTGSGTFLCQMKAHIFLTILTITPEILASNSAYF